MCFSYSVHFVNSLEWGSDLVEKANPLIGVAMGWVNCTEWIYIYIERYKCAISMHRVVIIWTAMCKFESQNRANVLCNVLQWKDLGQWTKYQNVDLLAKREDCKTSDKFIILSHSVVSLVRRFQLRRKLIKKPSKLRSLWVNFGWSWRWNSSQAE